MLGIPTYEPTFFNDSDLFIKTHDEKLRSLIGKVIDRYWVMWDNNENEWYPDGPVILNINDDHYEFCAYQLDEFSLTVNSIDLNKKLDWYGIGEGMPLSWKENGKIELNESINRPITEINILVFNFKSKNIETSEPYETGFMIHGIEFKLEKSQDISTYFSIFNALDQNGLSEKSVQQDDQIKRINITGYHNI